MVEYHHSTTLQGEIDRLRICLEIYNTKKLSLSDILLFKSATSNSSQEHNNLSYKITTGKKK